MVSVPIRKFTRRQRAPTFGVHFCEIFSKAAHLVWAPLLPWTLGGSTICVSAARISGIPIGATSSGRIASGMFFGIRHLLVVIRHLLVGLILRIIHVLVG